MTRSVFGGSILIGLAAMLWATDAPFRFPLSHRIDPTQIVFYEHLIVVLSLLPWIFLRTRSAILKMSPRDWILAAWIGAGASAIATVLFTASFRYVNPSVAILLQKMQPIFVILIAYVTLGERPSKSFYGWATLAIAAAFVLSAPNFHHEIQGIDFSTRGAFFALGAAALWASATVAGKVIVRQVPSSHVTFWRYVFGFIALAALLGVAGQSFLPAHSLQLPGDAYSLLYMAWIPGLASMGIYYIGLKKTPAGTATLVELTYPISAVLLNTWILHTPLSLTQIGAGILLLVSVFKISS